MQLVRVIYIDGSIRDIELPYVPFDQDRDMYYSESVLELRYLNEDGIYIKRTSYGQNTSLRFMNYYDDIGNLVVAKEDYPNIDRIKVDGEVILESDGEGGLIRPEDKLVAEVAEEEAGAAEADFSDWEDVLG